MGIRTKITVGFLSLAALLLFSWVISLFQLNRLDKQTEMMFDSGAKNMEYARQMLDAIQNQSVAVIQKQFLGMNDFDSVYTAGDIQLGVAIQKATVTVRDRDEMDEIYSAYSAYGKMMDDFRENGPMEISWFRESYRPAYFALSSAIKDYMISAQKTVQEKASDLGGTAYRAVTPGILALMVGIVILLIFLFLIDFYFARPIVLINQSLKGYLTNKIPFRVKVEGRDEVFQLGELIDDLVKSKKAE